MGRTGTAAGGTTCAGPGGGPWRTGVTTGATGTAGRGWPGAGWMATGVTTTGCTPAGTDAGRTGARTGSTPRALRRSLKRTMFTPNEITSPSRSSTGPVSGWPLTRVPERELLSIAT